MFNLHNDIVFTIDKVRVAVPLGFNDEGLTKTSSLDQLRTSFNLIMFDRLPVSSYDGVPFQREIDSLFQLHFLQSLRT